MTLIGVSSFPKGPRVHVLGAGEMALVFFPGDASSNPSIHVRLFTAVCNSSFRGFKALLCPTGDTDQPTDRQTHTYTHPKLRKKKKACMF